MATAQKIRWAQLRTGLLAAAALIILGVLVYLLSGSQPIFRREVQLYTYLDDSAALTKGAPVRLNGILVGKVGQVALSGSNQPGRIVRVTLNVDRNFLGEIPVDSEASISAENLLGTKYININKGRSGTRIQPGAELKAEDVQDFQEIVKVGYSTLASLQGIVKRVDAIVSLVEVGKGSIGKLLVDEELYNRALRIVGDVQTLTAALQTNKGTIGRLIYDETLYNDVRGTITRLDGLIDGLQRGEGTAGKFLKDPALYNEAQQTLTEVRRVVADLQAGKGTAGKLLKSEELHDQLRGSLGRIDQMLDRINAGQGTVGQLLVNQQLYDQLNGTTAELQGLLKDFRANPRKFLQIKLSLF